MGLVCTRRPVTQCNANKEIVRYEEEIRTNDRRAHTHIVCVCNSKRNRRDLCRSRRMSHKSLLPPEREKTPIY